MILFDLFDDKFLQSSETVTNMYHMYNYHVVI